MRTTSTKHIENPTLFKEQILYWSQQFSETIILDSNIESNENQLYKSYDLIVTKGTQVTRDQALTKDPNVGGFGQTETEIVLQSPARIYGYMALTLTIILTQIFLVIKKKQFEKVQASEMNF